MCTGSHPFIPAPNVAKLELICSANNQRVENVLWVRSGDVWNSASLTGLANSAIDQWNAEIAPHTSDVVELVLVRATDMGEDDGVGVEIAPATPAEGQAGTPILPNNVTVATKFATGFTGRSRRGRAYFIGLTEGQVVGNQINAGAQDNITNGWIDFFAGLDDGGAHVEHVIVSYCGGGDWRDEALITAVTNYSTEENIDSQRRRLTGRGQ